MSIAPGEPVPPGFEDEVKLIPELQPYLDSYKANVTIGLEYVVELKKPEDHEASYLCLLCDKRGDPRTIIAHITSYNHRLKYLEKHFPSVVRELVPYRYNSEARNLMPRLIQSICEAIEDHHGRLTLSVYDYAEFHRNRNRILQDIIREKHFDEKSGPNFVNVINKKEMDDQLRGKKSIGIESMKRQDSSPSNRAQKRDKDGNVMLRRSDNLDAISSDSDKSPLRHRSPKYRPNTFRRSRSRSGDRFGKRKRRSRSLSLSLSPPYRGGAPPRVHRSPPFDKRGPPKTTRSAAALSKQASELTQDKYKQEKFRAMVDNAVKELDKNLKEHEKNPEKHPLYPEEWKQFWNRRYKELQAEKKDPIKYDYKPEWIIFWTKRMKELHSEEIEKKKAEIRKQIGLKDSPNRSNLKDKLEVIDISDEETSPLSVSPVRSDYDRHERKSSSRYPENRERLYSHRERIVDPHSDYYHGSSSRDYHAPMSVPHSSRYGVRYMGPESYPKYEPEQKEEEEVDDGPLTVVAVLRLLTALEDQLGSLGPKIIDLLAKALALEKIKANSADEMLLNDDTSVFFETVKEKLKGQILAGVLDMNKVKAVKKAVKNIAAILHQVTENAKEKSNDQPAESEDAAKLKLLKTDILDRQLISSKLAAALVIHEKTDVTKDDMDRLINVFILMVKLSKERNSNVEVKDILLELGIETVIFDNEDDILSNISKVDSKDSNEVMPANATSSLESLTDSDLQTLLQNFKHLSSEEQHHLIAHLKKLESSDPLRVEKLRKFVDITELKKEKSSPRPEAKSFANVSKVNISSNFSDEEYEQKQNIMQSDDDDDDYNFDDVVKAASNNLKGGSKNEERIHSDSISRDRDGEMSNMSMGSGASANTNMSLANTKNLIDNLLGSLQKTNNMQSKNSKTNTIPTIGSGGSNPRQLPQNANNFYPQSQNSNQNYAQQQIQQQPINMFDSNYYPNNNVQQQGGQYNDNMSNNYPFNQYNPNQRQQQIMQSNFMNPQQQQQQQQQHMFMNQMQNQGSYF